MATNITPVTSLPWLELSRVKVRTSAVRSITTSLPAEGLEGTLGFLLVMAARYRRNAGLSNGAGAIWIKEMSGSPSIHRNAEREGNALVRIPAALGCSFRVAADNSGRTQK